MSKPAMAAYAQWRGTGITRTDLAAPGPRVSDLNLINLDFVKASEDKDRLVKKWLERYSR